MALLGKLLRSGAILAAMTASAMLVGCGVGDIDLQIDAPVLDAVGLNLSSKPKKEADIPERPGLVMPPSTATLPPPGERTAAAAQNWPADPDIQRKQKTEADAAAREQYCRNEAKWSGRGTISEYNKDIGAQDRCPSKFGEAISTALGGGPATPR